MTLRRKGTRVIVVNNATFRWTVAPEDEPGVAVVAELAGEPRGRLVSWYEHGVMITPPVVRHAIETAVGAGWDPTASGEVVQRLEGVWERTVALRQCPCCDYFTLRQRGSYEICRICFWEDDGADIDDLDRPSGPNHMTLREGRENFSRLGACAQRMLPHVLPVEARSRYAHAPRSEETELKGPMTKKLSNDDCEQARFNTGLGADEALPPSSVGPRSYRRLSNLTRGSFVQECA